MNKLRVTLALAFALSVLIPVTIVVSITFSQAQQHARDRFVQSMQGEVAQIDNAFSFLFKQIEDNVRFASRRPLIIDAAPQVPINLENIGGHTFEPDGSGSLNDQLYQYFLDYAASHSDLSYMYVSSTLGGYIQWPAGPLTDYYDPRPRPWYQAAMKADGKVTRSDAYYWQPDDAALVSTVTQIKNYDGNVIGVIGMDITLRDLTNLVNKFRYGETGYLMLVENNLNILVDAENPENNFTKLSDVANGNLTNLLANPNSKTVIISGEEYLANVYSSPFLGWHFIGLIKTAEVDATNNSLLQLTMSTTAISLVVFVALSILLSNSISGTILRKHKQLVEARKLAEQASEAKSNFLSTVSHEIRTPLNGIIGMAQILSDSRLNTVQREQLTTILSSGNSLLTIINDVLDMSKIEAEALELEEIPFSLKSALSSIFTPFATLATNKGIKLVEQAMPGNHDVLVGDPVRLRQILWNLLSNAIKFTEEGSVTVNVTISDSALPDAPSDHDITLKISVTDTGVGISKDRLKAIFDPFAQEDATITRKFGGTGLGLTIVQRIVDLMQGQVSIESEEGKGSRFTVSLPLRSASDEEAAVLLLPPQTTEIKNNYDHKILVAEDNPVNAQIATMFLKKRGCEVQIAENGRKAFELFQTMSPDLIFMDVHMPEMDGLTATAEIRKIESGSPVPIIGLTADVFKEHHKKFVAAGMNQVLTKPFKESQLEAILNKYLTPTTSVPDTDVPTTIISVQEEHPDNSTTPSNTSIGDKAIITQMVDQLGIEVVEGLFELAPQDLAEQWKKLQDAVQQDDKSEAQMALHTIKSSVLSLGAVALSNLASELEYQTEDLHIIQDAMPRMEELVQQTLDWWELEFKTFY